MKLTNKQKTIIRKSLKLNEDFFDDLDDNELIDEPNHDLENEYNQQYTYHFQFIFHLWPFIKYNNNSKDGYYFENPKYKLIIESGFLSMKKALNCILLSSHIVTEYSEPKFCTLSDKFISIFPFMNNEPEDQLLPAKDDKPKSQVYKEIFNGSISLEMTLNLSNKKNQDNVKKLLYSFYKLDVMYNNLIKKFKPDLIGIPSVEFGYFRNNPFFKMGFFKLLSSTSVTKQYPSYIANILLTDYEELKKMHDDAERKFQELI